MPKRIVFVLLLIVFAAPVQGAYLYKTTLLRAAPGKLLPLIELQKSMQKIYRAAGVEPPFWMRHSQGDHWDLLLLEPIGSYQAFYGAARLEKLEAAAAGAGLSLPEMREQMQTCVAWHEDVFVWGPPIETVRRAFAGAGYFHVEMFLALPGKHTALLQEREMENGYLAALGRPQNLIFRHDSGASWDAFTIGCYRDLKHFAESADIPAEKEEAAARRAGFEGANRIGTYLRTLIARHNDTLAVAIR